MKFLLLLTLVVGVFALSDPDEERSIEELIESRGFGVEVHSVTTEDGYILSVHRITSKDGSIGPLKPVILQHGLVGSASDFLVNSPHLHSNDSKYGDTLGFALKLTGRYDVWLSNSRGSRYSQGHVRYTTLDLQYWNFSFEHMAVYDLPAVIEYVQHRSNSSKVAYVGYSQGTAIMFALLGLRPEYAQVVQPFIAMAPVAFVGHNKSPVRYFARSAPILRLIGGEFLPSVNLVNLMAEMFCRHQLRAVCRNLMFLIGGSDYNHLNSSRIDVYLHFTPSSTSTWDIAHWAQLVNSDRFARFDYGTAQENFQAYGVKLVPDYPLHNVSSKAKIALFRGLNDVFVQEEDISRLKRILAEEGKVDLIEDFVVSDPNWTHLDFIFGLNSGRLFIDRLIQVLDTHS